MVQIRQEFIDEMVAHAKSDLPNECCGILAGSDGQVMKVYRMTNVEASPFRFVMDPLELVNVDSEAGDNNWEVLAIYHSHTGSEAYPSDTDVRIAGGTAGLWPDVRYVLVSLMDMDNSAGYPLRTWFRNAWSVPGRCFAWLSGRPGRPARYRQPVVRIFEITDGTVTEEPLEVL